MMGLVACNQRTEVVDTDASLQLRFEKDAIVLDTVFTDLRTPTYRFRVYNPHARALRISQIELLEGADSPYQVVVNGKPGTRWQDILLRAGDSLLVLVSAVLPGSTMGDEPELFYDELLFLTNGNLQRVPIISWGQSVYHVQGTIDCDATWQAGKPYILYDSVSVAPGCSLTIEAGSRIYAFNRASLHVFGTLIVNGTENDSVLIGGFRREPLYERAVGLWRGILLYPNPTSVHKLYHCTIRNAQVAILCSDVEVEAIGCQIYHASLAGWVAYHSTLRLYNSVISNCIDRLLQAAEGGSYELIHCTLANYEFDFFRNNEPGTVFVQSADDPPMQVRLFNSVFWGNLNDEIIFSGPALSLEAAHNVFKTRIYSAQVLNPNNNQNQVNPSGRLFVDERRLRWQPAENSPLIGRGMPISSLPKDILGHLRKNPPDIGAFEFIP